jgi:hypothetical protein
LGSFLQNGHFWQVIHLRQDQAAPVPSRVLNMSAHFAWGDLNTKGRDRNVAQKQKIAGRGWRIEGGGWQIGCDRTDSFILLLNWRNENLDKV